MKESSNLFKLQYFTILKQKKNYRYLCTNLILERSQQQFYSFLSALRKKKEVITEKKKKRHIFVRLFN